MSFAHPWMLLGTLGALIPLLVHLFDRRRPRPHPFGAIAFVLRSQRRTASRLKLKRLLLYLLRTLILLALPIALARPEWKRELPAGVSPHGAAATAIVLDTSLSMRWSEGGSGGATSNFERARDEARSALRELSPEEPATLLLCGDAPLPPEAPGFDKAKLRQHVDDAQPGYGRADVSRCLELAAQALEESPLPGKRLVLVSDLTANAFHLEAPAPTVKGPQGEPVRPEVVLRDASAAKELPNRAIVDLKIEPALQVGPRAFQFTFTVRNFSSETVKNLEATLKVEGQVVAKGFLDLAPGGTAQKSLSHRFETGGPVTGEVAIEGDALGVDDVRAFALTVPKELKALIVNGAPAAVRYRDEAFFVETALSAPGSPVRAALKDAESGLKEDFSGYDLVLLLNVAAPDAETAQRLAAFVEKGGGLFVSMGDNVVPKAYNERFGALLPRALRDAKTSVNAEETDAERLAARLTEVAMDHAVFSLFTGAAREGLSAARFYRYMLLEATGNDAAGSVSGSGKEGSRGGTDGTKGTARVLAAFEDGAPALVTQRHGRGRVLLFTSTVDRDWSDLAIRTSFLPLVQRFCAYLTGSLDEREEVRGRVGQTLVLKVPSGRTLAQVKSPSGQEVPIQTLAGDARAVGPLPEPGLYHPVDSSGAALGESSDAMAFTASVDPSESDLTRLAPEALASHFGEGSVRVAEGTQSGEKTPLWTWLLVTIAVAFFLEGVLLKA